MVNEVLDMLQTSLKDLVELAVAEAERDPSIDIEVLDSVDVGHLDEDVVKSCQREEHQSFITHGLQAKEILDDALNLWVVEPGHFSDFG